MILTNILGGSCLGVFYDTLLEYFGTVDITTENLSY
jgi:hypothetical protein